MEQLEMLGQLGKLKQLKDLAELAGFGSQFSGIIEQVTFVLAVIVLILALIQCFCGYRLLRFFVTVIGFIAGFILGAALVMMSGENRPVPLIILAGVTAGALIAILSFKLYLAGVFLYCGLLAAALVVSIPFPEQTPWNMARLVLAGVVFLAAGILAVKFQRQVVIAVSAVIGGIAASQALRKIVPEMAEDPGMSAAAGIILVILGIAVQLLSTRSRQKNKKKR